MNTECFDGCQMGGTFGRMGEEVRGLRSTNWQSQSGHGDVKYSVGIRVAKELICMIHGREQRLCGLPMGVGLLGERGKWRKNWDNRNSIINNIKF